MEKGWKPYSEWLDKLGMFTVEERQFRESLGT